MADFKGIKGLEYVGADILEAITKIVLNGEAIYLTEPQIGQVLTRVQVDEGVYAWINQNPPATAAPFQMIVAKDIEAGTIQEYPLILMAIEYIKVDSIAVRCDNGSLTGCTLLIGTTEVELGGDLTFDITADLVQIYATDNNLIESGSEVKLVTSEGFTGTPTTIYVQLNYSLQ